MWQRMPSDYISIRREKKRSLNDVAPSIHAYIYAGMIRHIE